MSDSKQLLCNLDYMYQFVALTQCRPDLCIIGLVSYWTKHSRYRLFSQFHGVLCKLSVMSLSVILPRYWSYR